MVTAYLSQSKASWWVSSSGLKLHDPMIFANMGHVFSDKHCRKITYVWISDVVLFSKELLQKCESIRNVHEFDEEEEDNAKGPS